MKFLRGSEAVGSKPGLSGGDFWRFCLSSDDVPNLASSRRAISDAIKSSYGSGAPDAAIAFSAAVLENVSGTGAHTETFPSSSPDGGRGWIEATGHVVRHADGSVEVATYCKDVTRRVENELELNRRLKQQTAVALFGTYALAETSIDTIVKRAAEVAVDILDVPLAKILQILPSTQAFHFKAGVGWSEGLVGQAEIGLTECSQAGFTLVNDGPVIVEDFKTEKRFPMPPMLRDHGVRSGMSVIIPGSGATPFGVFGVFSRKMRSFDNADVDFLVALGNIIANSVRHNAAATRQGLLIRELVHRAGNMLQVVSSIANQTMMRNANPAVARAKFSERLAALSRANHLVADGGWTSTRMRHFVSEMLKPYMDRLVLHGSDVKLPADLCFDLGLVLFEIAQNSLAYGSLGREEGQIRVDWALLAGRDGADHFTFAWFDPVSSGKSASRGFGSRLLSAIVERKWNGRVDVDSREGFRLTLDIPNVAAADAGRAWTLPGLE